MKNVLEFNVYADFFNQHGFKPSGRVIVGLKVYSAKNGVPTSFEIERVATTEGAEWWLELPLSKRKEDIKFWWVNAKLSPISDPMWWVRGEQKRVAVPSWVQYSWDAKPGNKGF
jgi:hypothetical protein